MWGLQTKYLRVETTKDTQIVLGVRLVDRGQLARLYCTHHVPRTGYRSFLFWKYISAIVSSPHCRVKKKSDPMCLIFFVSPPCLFPFTSRPLLFPTPSTSTSAEPDPSTASFTFLFFGATTWIKSGLGLMFLYFMSTYHYKLSSHSHPPPILWSFALCICRIHWASSTNCTPSTNAGGNIVLVMNDTSLHTNKYTWNLNQLSGIMPPLPPYAKIEPPA